MLILSWLILAVAARPDEKLRSERDAQRKNCLLPVKSMYHGSHFDYIVPLLMLSPVSKNRNPINKDE